jgi:hypothetical protein
MWAHAGNECAVYRRRFGSGFGGGFDTSAIPPSVTISVARKKISGGTKDSPRMYRPSCSGGMAKCSASMSTPPSITAARAKVLARKLGTV